MSIVQTLYSRLEIMCAAHRERYENIAVGVADEDPLFARDISTVLSTDDAVQHLLLHRPEDTNVEAHGELRVAVGRLEHVLTHGPPTAIPARFYNLESLAGGLPHLLKFDRVRRMVMTAPFIVVDHLFRAYARLMTWATTNTVIVLMDAAIVGRRAADRCDARVVGAIIDAIAAWRKQPTLMPVGDLDDIFSCAMRQRHVDVARALVGRRVQPFGAPFHPLLKSTVGLFRPWYIATEDHTLGSVLQHYDANTDMPFADKPETAACMAGDVHAAVVFGRAINTTTNPGDGATIIIHAALSIPDVLLVPLFTIDALDVNACDHKGYTLLSTILYRRLAAVPNSNILHVLQALLYCKDRALLLEPTEWQFRCPGNPFFSDCVAVLNAEVAKRPVATPTMSYTTVDKCVLNDDDEEDDEYCYEDDVDSDGEYRFVESAPKKRQCVLVQ
jgi:hypothetical protein